MLLKIFYVCLYTRVDLTSKFRKWKSGFSLSEKEITNKRKSRMSSVVLD